MTTETNTVDWPRRWGLSWQLAAAVILLAYGALYVRPAATYFFSLADLMPIIAFICLWRSAYWRGYSRGRSAVPTSSTDGPDGRR